jgi:hypothetical protein
MDQISLGLTGIAWNVGSQLRPDWNGFEWKKSVFAWLKFLKIQFHLQKGNIIWKIRYNFGNSI